MFKVNNRSTTHHSGVVIVNLYLARSIFADFEHANTG